MSLLDTVTTYTHPKLVQWLSGLAEVCVSDFMTIWTNIGLFLITRGAIKYYFCISAV
jgi:hypothetical protein